MPRANRIRKEFIAPPVSLTQKSWARGSRRRSPPLLEGAVPLGAARGAFLTNVVTNDTTRPSWYRDVPVGLFLHHLPGFSSAPQDKIANAQESLHPHVRMPD